MVCFPLLPLAREATIPQHCSRLSIRSTFLHAAAFSTYLNMCPGYISTTVMHLSGTEHPSFFPCDSWDHQEIDKEFGRLLYGGPAGAP